MGPSLLLLYTRYDKMIMFIGEVTQSLFISIGGVRLKTLFNVVIIASSIFLIISILFQPSNPEGMGSITGGVENVWGKNRDRSMEGTLQRLTTISAFIFMISALVLAAMQ